MNEEYEMLPPPIQWAIYAILAFPALLLFVIVNLWLCLQIKAVWKILTGKRSGSRGYTSYRFDRTETGKRKNGHGKTVKDTVSGQETLS